MVKVVKRRQQKLKYYRYCLRKAHKLMQNELQRYIKEAQ